MLQDSPKEGGLWLKTLCQSCNGIAGRYDDAYGAFATSMGRINRLESRHFAWPRSDRVPAVSVAPGRVARSVLHGMAALTPSLKHINEQFLDDLLGDGEIRMPPGLQLRVALINHRRCRISSGYWMSQVLGFRQHYNVIAEICFYPFLWALCGESPRTLGSSLMDLEAWGDATDWIRYNLMATRSDLRDVLKNLPMTSHPTLRDRNNWIDLRSDERSFVLEGEIRY